MPDEPAHVASILNYPPAPRHRVMAYAFLDSAIRHGAERLTLFYHDHRPEIAPEHAERAAIEVRQGVLADVGHPHFNLRFKLPNLAGMTEPFLFIDADTVIVEPLAPLWRLRHAKPWIGIDHQWVPRDERTHRPRFLNSGVQLVGDPDFYDLDAILAVQNAAAPLKDADFAAREDFKTFLCPGADQAVLFRYFQTTGYDYTHPDATPGWNHCAGVTEVYKSGTEWKARSRGMVPEYPVQIVHYWDQYKPWRLGDPIYCEHARKLGLDVSGCGSP